MRAPGRRQASSTAGFKRGKVNWILLHEMQPVDAFTYWFRQVPKVGHDEQGVSGRGVAALDDFDVPLQLSVLGPPRELRNAPSSRYARQAKLTLKVLLHCPVIPVTAFYVCEN